MAFLHRNPTPIIYKEGTKVWAYMETMKLGNISPELHFASSGPPNNPSLETMGRARYRRLRFPLWSSRWHHTSYIGEWSGECQILKHLLLRGPNPSYLLQLTEEVLGSQNTLLRTFTFSKFTPLRCALRRLPGKELVTPALRSEQ